MTMVSLARLLRSFAQRKFFLACLCFFAVTSHAGTTSYTYDVHGRLKTQTFANGTDAVTITNNLDNAGNRTSLVTVSVDATGPNVPTGLSATVISAQQINLSWSATTDIGSSGLAGYRIKRRIASLAWTTLGSTASTSYSDTTVTGNTNYSYTVSAYDNANNYSAESAQVSQTTPLGADTVPPTQPTALTATAVTSNWVNLSWAGSTDSGGSGLSGYQVWRNGSQLGFSSVASYADQSTQGTTSYSYFVKAMDGAGNPSSPSNTASVTTPDTLKPTQPSLNQPTLSGIQVNLTWSTSTDQGGSGFAGYQVIRNGSVIASTSATSYTDSSTVSVASYSYVIRALDGVGNFIDSNQVAVTTPDNVLPSAPGTPTFSPIGPVTATAAWSAASDNVGVTGYHYSLSGGAWIDVGMALSVNLTGLSLGTTYSVTVQARDAAGNWGATSNNSFTTSAYFTDTMSLVSASSGSVTATFFLGYIQSTMGSLTPNTTSNGKTVTQFYYWEQDQYDPETMNFYPSNWGMSLAVTGFNGNPGADWLQSAGGLSGSSATFGCVNSSTCIWNWSTSGLIPSTFVIVHK
jgi:YD repeat-containing protein